jgi:hypothetical protein
MADFVTNKSLGELVDPKAAASYLSWTAGGASDAVTWTGITIDREAFSTGSLPKTLDAIVFYDATLGSGKTLSLTIGLQTSPDNSTWTDYATETATVVSTGASGGSRNVGVARIVVPSSNKPTGTPGVDLTSAQRYVRLNVLADLSATGTDTGITAAVLEFGGFDILASPQT